MKSVIMNEMYKVTIAMDFGGMMNQVKRLYVEKKRDYAIRAKELAEELQSYLSLQTLSTLYI